MSEQTRGFLYRAGLLLGAFLLVKGLTEKEVDTFVLVATLLFGLATKNTTVKRK